MADRAESESRKLLAGLDRNKPVVIRAYVSDEVPEQLVQQRRLLLNLVDQFDAIGGDAVQKDVEDRIYDMKCG